MQHGVSDTAPDKNVVLLLWTLSLACIVNSVVSDAQDITNQLLSCYESTGDATAATFEGYISSREEYSRLVLHRVFSSAKASSLPLTVLAGVTMSRLDALQAQCESWPGPLVAAVYVAIPATVPLAAADGGRPTAKVGEGLLAAAEEVVKTVFDSMETSKTGCQLRVLLLYEAAADAHIGTLMPINSMRNAALLAATTPLVAMIDVDLLLSASLAREFTNATRSAALHAACLKRREVLILPAFETEKKLSMDVGRQLALQAAKGSKRDLFRAMQQLQLHSFAQFAYARGHNATNYKRWLSSAAAYRVHYQVNYEPWFIIDRLASPLYDMRFRGYGWNKVAQVATVNATGFKLMVHPSAFLVHRPHDRTGAQAFFTTAASGSRASATSIRSSGSSSNMPLQLQQAKQFHRKVGALRHLVVRDLKRGTYAPVVDAATRRCLTTLPWWKDWQRTTTSTAHGASR